MTKYQGKGVYGAIAIGKISVFSRGAVSVKRERTDNPTEELKRFEYAKKAALEQLDGIYKKALREVGEANAAIFEIHKMMVEDEDYNEAVEELITGQGVNAEYAVAVTGDNFAEMFSSMDDAYMQARAADVRDVSNRIISCLSGSEGSAQKSGEPTIVCADDLAPSETVSLDKDKVLAFVTAYGSSNSHTAILARNMNIPAIISVGEEFLGKLRSGDLAIVNGFTGEVIINPSEAELKNARKRQAEEREKSELLHRLRGKENVTLDGRRIDIFANIGSADNIGEVLVNDAGGIGLFRSEFIYLEKSDFPSEDEQFRIYKRVLESMAGKRVIIRTLDIGADKKCSYFGLPEEENPALGVRALRICLNRPEIFRTQLRALFRASAFGNLGIMFPMVANLWELEEALSICDGVKNELRSEGIDYSEKTELGIMIETPAAAVISDRLAPLVDFFSVGTNDLIQYTLACDRQNPYIDRFCDERHEAVLRLISLAAENAHKNGKWIGICGELAADVSLTEAFLRMGIDELSVAPPFVLRVREAVRGIRLS